PPPEEIPDLQRKIRKVLFGSGSWELRERLALARSALEGGEPTDGLPGARVDEDGDHPNALGLPAFEQPWDLGVADETGGQNRAGPQQHGHGRPVERRFDLRPPIVASGDLPVLPDGQHVLQLEDLQVADNPLFPVLILMAVADEDRGAVRPGAR